jgi:hypothetical protein
MSRDLLWIGFLGVVYVLIKYKPDWLNQIVIAVAGRAVGRAALDRQPDHLTLQPLAEPPARPEARSAIDSLQRRGFVAGGSYSIGEMGNMPVHFLLKQDEGAVAVIYEHPKVGVWCDIACRFQDGSSFTITNAKMGGGLDPRPGHTTVRVPGLTPTALHLRYSRERPAGQPRLVSPADVATVFADAWAEEMAWRKDRGVSRQEVRAVSRERADRSAA